MRFIIIGLGYAGYTAAKIIRRYDPRAEVLLFSDDQYSFYPRPRLYDIIKGTEPKDIVVHSSDWYLNNDLDLYLDSTVERIVSDKNQITLNNGKKYNYDKLLVAVGSNPIVPPIEGMNDVDYYCLRTINDALAIRNSIKERLLKRVTIVGAGLLGIELATTLSTLGIHSSIIDRNPYVMKNQLDPQGGMFLQDIFEEKYNVEFIMNANCRKVTQFKKKISVEIKCLSEHIVHESDDLLLTAGVKPNINLAKQSGIDTNRGILVDMYLQTNLNNVFAAGDVVEIPNVTSGLIPVAIEQAKIAALNMLDQQVIYQHTTPWFILKIADIQIASIGKISTQEGIQEMVLPDQNKDHYRKLFFKDEQLQGAILIGTKKDFQKIKQMIIKHTSRRDVTKLLNL